MNVTELTREQLMELKQQYLTELADAGEFADVMGTDYDEPSYDDLMCADDLISDADIYRIYDGVEFVADDFYSPFGGQEFRVNVVLSQPFVRTVFAKDEQEAKAIAMRERFEQGWLEEYSPTGALTVTWRGVEKV